MNDVVTKDIFSVRRTLDLPVGIPLDFSASEVLDPAFVDLAKSPSINSRLKLDTMPIPSVRDREGYYGDRHFDYWLSGLSDYLKVKNAVQLQDWTQAKLLDLGGATGRTARHFYAQENMTEVMISDLNINNVEWVLENMPSGIAAFKNSSIPSLPISDDYFDVVTAFSVFTHMNEYELAWLYELRRILKPNGFLYVTVHNDDTWDILPSTWVYGTLIESEGFRATFASSAKLQERLSFDYSPDEAYNCNTFHPNSYIHRVWGRIFHIRGIDPVCHGYQSAVVMQKESRTA
jgi:SAM-dependent methyltransferase